MALVIVAVSIVRRSDISSAVSGPSTAPPILLVARRKPRDIETRFGNGSNQVILLSLDVARDSGDPTRHCQGDGQKAVGVAV
jgi:hypothetical protein